MIRKRVLAIIGTAVVALGTGIGIAQASVPDSSGVIHGCYHPQTDGHSSALGVIDTALSNGHCPSGQTEVTWPGVTPPQTAGSGGLGVEVIYAFASPDGANTIDAVCPANHPYVLGGGYWNSSGATVDISAPGIAYTDNGTYPVGPRPEKGDATGAPGPGGEQAGPFTFNAYTAANAWLVRAPASADTLNVWAICSE